MGRGTSIYVQPGTAELIDIGQYLAEKLRPATGFRIQVLTATRAPESGNIYLTTAGGDPALGEEGYELTVTPDRVSIVAYQPAGLFRGIQTIRQLLPAPIESPTLQPGPWGMAGVTIRDQPRFVWRGAMLDVARHFFGVQDVKRYIDLMAYYKINRFHFHLTDNEGWRIEIRSWPKLATVGGNLRLFGNNTGYYTQEQYSEIVAYAQSRYIMVIPEIEMPGHMYAALASYRELIKYGLDLGKDSTYKFVDDVVREISALTPGPYIHVGGDEAYNVPIDEYIHFIDTVQTIVQGHGKQLIGWDEITDCHLLSTSIAQHWRWYGDFAQRAVLKGAKVIMSPANKIYLDMKYDGSTRLGQTWAGYIEVQDAYTWDPATQSSGVTASSILGVEAPLWTETIVTMADIEYMAFPRLAGHAEIGWSPQAGRTWDEYKVRLGAHGKRLTGMGVNFYRSPQIPWQ
jgi:hexosaminidase